MRFWISLVDATDASWAYGPLHSGGNGPTDCLYLAGNSLTFVNSFSLSVFPPNVLSSVECSPQLLAPAQFPPMQW